MPSWWHIRSCCIDIDFVSLVTVFCLCYAGAMGLTSAEGIALPVSFFWPPRIFARRCRRKQKGLCCLSVILYESCMLIHYCASSMLCDFLLLLQALLQYVMCSELCIRVLVILHSKELGQGSKQRCWFLGSPWRVAAYFASKSSTVYLKLNDVLGYCLVKNWMIVMYCLWCSEL